MDVHRVRIDDQGRRGTGVKFAHESDGNKGRLSVEVLVGA